MSLKQQFSPLAAFSMSSMADVIFLLLIFFMVTSTIIIPSALDVNLPESTDQTLDKPSTEVYIDSLSRISLIVNRNDSVQDGRMPRSVSLDELQATLQLMREQGDLKSVALYADSVVPYASVVRVLDLAARSDIKMVLATRPAAVTIPEP